MGHAKSKYPTSSEECKLNARLLINGYIKKGKDDNNRYHNIFPLSLIEIIFKYYYIMMYPLQFSTATIYRDQALSIKLTKNKYKAIAKTGSGCWVNAKLSSGIKKGIHCFRILMYKKRQPMGKEQAI